MRTSNQTYLYTIHHGKNMGNYTYKNVDSRLICNKKSCAVTSDVQDTILNIVAYLQNTR